MSFRVTFDQLFARGARAVLAGVHSRDVPPVDGGARWGLSVVLRPDPAAAARLAAATGEVLAVAGDGHWPTGSAGTVHATVWALERHRTPIPAGDPAVERYAAAVRTAAARCGPVRLRFGGLTLTPSGVMACAYPVDGAAASVSRAVAQALGPAGWLEAGVCRDIWYATLVHFTGAVPGRQELVEWVAERRDWDLGVATCGELVLASWQFNGRQPVLCPLAAVPLAGGSARPGQSRAGVTSPVS